MFRVICVRMNRGIRPLIYKHAELERRSFSFSHIQKLRTAVHREAIH